MATGTFGNTTIEASSTLYNDDVRGTLGTPDYSGDVSKITVYLVNWAAGEAVKCALYNSSDGSLVAETEELDTGGANGWYDFDFASAPAVTGGSSYLVCVLSDSNVAFMWAVDTGVKYAVQDDVGGAFPDPVATSTGYKFSIYATYTHEVSPSISPSVSPSLSPSASPSPSVSVSASPSTSPSASSSVSASPSTSPSPSASSSPSVSPGPGEYALTLLNSSKGFTKGDLRTGGYLMMEPAFQIMFFADGRKRADGCYHKLNFRDDVITGVASGEFSVGETMVQAVSGAEGIFYESVGNLHFIYRTEVTPFDTTNLITGQTTGETVTPTAITYPPYWTPWITRTLTDPAAWIGTVDDSTNYLPIGGSNIGALFMGRIFINSIQNPHLWFASRHRDPLDFRVAQDDLGTPVSAQSSKLGTVGKPICSMIPFMDHYMYFGCLSEIWCLRGDPASSAGTHLTVSSRKVGMFGPDSWAFDEKGNLFFLSMDGFYMFQRNSGFSGEPPENLTYKRLPNLVTALGLNRRTDKVVMAYDKDRYGIDIDITMYDGTYGSSWFWDLRLNALLPQSFAEPKHYGSSLYYYDSRKSETRGLLRGCYDGYISKYDSDQKDDRDSNAIDAYCTLGPYQAFNRMRRQGQLQELLLRLGDDSDGVDVDVYAGDAAESVVKSVKNADLADARTTMTGGGIRPVYRPKSIGSVFCIQLRNNNSNERFAIEKVTAKITDAGEVKGA